MRHIVVVLLLAMMVQPADCFIHHIIGWIGQGVRAIHRQKVPVSSFKSELKSVSERMRCIVLLFVVLLMAMMVLPAEGFFHHLIGLIHHGASLIHSQKVPVSSFKSELKSVSERMRCIFLLFVVLLLAMMVLPAEGFFHHLIGLIHHGASLIHSQKVPVSSFKSELKSVSERMRCIFLLFVVLLLAMMVLPAEGFFRHLIGLIHHGASLFG
ncbi:unnamed protein product [Arctogadus glacialis]